MEEGDGVGEMEGRDEEEGVLGVGSDMKAAREDVVIAGAVALPQQLRWSLSSRQQ